MIYLFSNLPQNAAINFDPSIDTLVFDGPGQAAAGLKIVQSGANLSLSMNGKTVLLTNTPLASLSSVSIDFSDGSALYIGDDLSPTLADFLGKAFIVSDSDKDNQFQGLGGSDTVVGGSGDDWIVGNAALSKIVHVSASNGKGARTDSTGPTISADGKLVSFEGGWKAFGSESNQDDDVFVKNLANGAFSNEHQTSAGDIGPGMVSSAAISADGQFLAFASSSNLTVTPPVVASTQIYLASTTNNSIQAVSTDLGGNFANQAALNADVSGDGQFVVFESKADNLVGGTNTYSDIYLKDTESGAITRISTSVTDGDANRDARNASVSTDGHYVVFDSEATNLTAQNTTNRDIFVWNAETDTLDNITAGIGGPGNSSNADVGADGFSGNVVAFQSEKRLDEFDRDTNNAADIYVYRINENRFVRVSTSSTGAQANNDSSNASVSADGRFIAFQSKASNLVAGDTNGVADVFVKDILTGAIARVSVAANGKQGNAASGAALEISYGGDFIVFESQASNLAGSDRNGKGSDVFRVVNPLVRDDLKGGNGNDTYVLSRKDIVAEFSNQGTDTVRANFAYTLGANLENLVLTGKAAINGTGNGLNNTLAGNAKANVLNGKAGQDTASYAEASVGVVVSLAVKGKQDTNAGRDTLISIEKLIGSDNNDTLTGNQGNNALDGGAGRDRLKGGTGADLLVGGSGADILNAGADGNRDVFILRSVSHSEVGAGSRDQIQAFDSGEDDIDLRAIDANSATNGNQAFIFNRTTAQAHSVWLVDTGSNLLVRGDVNGDTVADFEIEVTSINTLSASDFLL